MDEIVKFVKLYQALDISGYDFHCNVWGVLCKLKMAVISKSQQAV